MLTLAWNVVESVVALAAGARAESLALVGFGADSVIEAVASAAALHGFRRGGTGEEPALKVIGATFLALAVYVLVEGIADLRGGTASEPSAVGMVLASLSLVVMPALALAKRRIGRTLGSRVLEAESTETLFCAALSLTLLLGLGLNAALGWWWADPVAALLMIPLLVREGLEHLGVGG